jgi:hypothetical protein
LSVKDNHRKAPPEGSSLPGVRKAPQGSPFTWMVVMPDGTRHFFFVRTDAKEFHRRTRVL